MAQIILAAFSLSFFSPIVSVSIFISGSIHSVSRTPAFPVDALILKQAFAAKSLRQPQLPGLFGLLIQVESDLSFPQNANTSPALGPIRSI